MPQKKYTPEEFKIEASHQAKKMSFLSFADIEECDNKSKSYEFGFVDGAFLAFNHLQKKNQNESLQPITETINLPTDEEVKEWFEKTITQECSASSAIYLFRLYLKDRMTNK
jgi:hypothetical protein